VGSGGLGGRVWRWVPCAGGANFSLGDGRSRVGDGRPVRRRRGLCSPLAGYPTGAPSSPVPISPHPPPPTTHPFPPLQRPESPPAPSPAALPLPLPPLPPSNASPSASLTTSRPRYSGRPAAYTSTGPSPPSPHSALYLLLPVSSLSPALEPDPTFSGTLTESPPPASCSPVAWRRLSSDRESAGGPVGGQAVVPRRVRSPAEPREGPAGRGATARGGPKALWGRRGGPTIV